MLTIKRNMNKPPRDFDKLRQEIAARLPKLSRRLQQIARFSLEHPKYVALENVTMIASHIGVPPSAIIRFAKALDYRGFSDMQAVFRLPLSDSLSDNHREILSRPGKTSGERARPDAVALLDMLGDYGTVSVKQMLHDIPPERLEQAAELLANRNAIYVIGQHGAFSMAAYLGYALTHLGRPVHLLDGVGGMLFEQASSISDRDVLIAVSLSPYAPEMTELAVRAASKGAAVIAIADSPFDPFSGTATVYLEVREQRVHSLPLLTATLCLIQALVIDVSLRLEEKCRCSDGRVIRFRQ